jgi:hypothetical protein
MIAFDGLFEGTLGGSKKGKRMLESENIETFHLCMKIIQPNTLQAIE